MISFKQSGPVAVAEVEDVAEDVVQEEEAGDHSGDHEAPLAAGHLPINELVSNNL